jgi:hypothetical protein
MAVPTAAPILPTDVTATRVPPPPVAPRGWLVGPWFDALLIANLGWPLAALAPVGDLFGGQDGVAFWQLYYVTTPHRWITLALVFLDRERFVARRGLFLALAVAAVGLVLGVRLTTGALTCLLAVDYVWNAWHFAAQHHGIYRIYGRLAEPSAVAAMSVEKWALRGFLLYVILRVAAATSPEVGLTGTLLALDWVAVLVPAGLLVSGLRRAAGRRSPGGLLYLASVSALYLSLLWAVHERRLGLVLALATASALFHALEYLALVSWSVKQRHTAVGQRMGLLGLLAPRWGIALGAFVLILGAGGWLMDRHWLETWLTLNVIVALLHYSYDGMIWRRRAA